MVRQDILEPDRLFQPPAPRGGDAPPFRVGLYRSLGRTLTNKFIYIGNLHALRLWYLRARAAFMTADPWAAACREGALARIETVLRERSKRLLELVDRMPRSRALARAVEEGRLPPELDAQQRRWMERGAGCHARAGGTPRPADRSSWSTRSRMA